MQIHRNYSLKHLNTFGIDAKAAFFATPGNLGELRELLLSEQFKAMPKLILGGGSNLLFTGDYPGLIIQNSLKGIRLIHEDADHYYVRAMAGVNWHKLVLHCISRGFAGIENLSLIPGSSGAAPIQNIGAYGVELKDVFHSLRAIDLRNGKSEEFNREDCDFGYRNSVFKNELKGKYFITSVTLKLNKKPVFHTEYGAIKDVLKEKGIHELSIKHISDAVIEIRKSKLPDPAVLGNAGSFFKNPEIDKDTFESIKKEHPGIPGYDAPGGRVKVAAGWLIDQLGWKGKKMGDAGVHLKQALVMVNYGNAEGKEILELAMKVRASVKENFGINLEPEVNII